MYIIYLVDHRDTSRYWLGLLGQFENGDCPRFPFNSPTESVWLVPGTLEG